MDSEKIKAEIDNDAGLHSKRKLLVVMSAILLALSFSGAEVDEANTFIFKIKFTNQNGLGILLVLSIVFLMIRYYNYAKPYHNLIYTLWTERLLARPFFYTYSYHCLDENGLVPESRNSKIIVYLLSFDDPEYEMQDYHVTYIREWIFLRFIVHSWKTEDDEEGYTLSEHHKVNILTAFGLKKYLITLWNEAKELCNTFLTYRKNLDIHAPYIIGFLEIASY